MNFGFIFDEQEKEYQESVSVVFKFKSIFYELCLNNSRLNWKGPWQYIYPSVFHRRIITCF